MMMPFGDEYLMWPDQWQPGLHYRGVLPTAPGDVVD